MRLRAEAPEPAPTDDDRDHCRRRLAEDRGECVGDGCNLLNPLRILLGEQRLHRGRRADLPADGVPALLKPPFGEPAAPFHVCDAEAAEDVIPRLGSALIVEVEDRSPQVERVLAERDD